MTMSEPKVRAAQSADAVPDTVPDVVTVRLPASAAYVSVLRTTTASLAARLDFTIDEIEDLRIAVDEACGLLLAKAASGTDLICVFELLDGTLRVSTTAECAVGTSLTRDSFAWTVLTALAGEVDSTTTPDGTTTIVLAKHREGMGEGTSDDLDGEGDSA